MLARNIFGAKKGSHARGLAWETVVDSLNVIHSPKFQLKDKLVRQSQIVQSVMQDIIYI